MKKIIALVLLVTILVGCSQSTKKFVGSRDTEYFSCDIEIYDTVQELDKDSELVVLGVVEEIVEVKELFNEETLYASKILFRVKERIKGNINTETIFVLQMGKPISDDCETKLQQKKEYILFLNSKTFKGETVYDCAGIEQGIFEVKENGKIYSYVDFGASYNFDNQTVESLKAEITK